MEESVQTKKFKLSTGNLVSIGIIMFVVLLGNGLISRYKGYNVTPTPIPSVVPSPSEVPNTVVPTRVPTTIPTEIPITYKEIGPDESVRVQCGEEANGTRADFKGSFAGNVGLSQEADIIVRVSDTNGQPAGGLVEWKLYYYGKLRVNGCSATFIAPSGIGTARQVSATITARVVSNNPTPTSASLGEGGPINAGFVATTKINILSSGGGSSCYNPAGVAISVNSPSTFDNVQIVVDTPKFLGRQYNSRVATVRDGVGTYNIEVYLNGNLYGSTSTYVDTCEMATVKY